MDIETLREFCLSLPYTTEEFPFDEYVLAFKVEGKIFLFTDLSDDIPWANVKCDPDKALYWRDRYDYVLPGYHMNKRLWNTIDYTRARDEQMRQWICHSYIEVVRKFAKSQQDKYLSAVKAHYPQYIDTEE
ncbi:MAG: MmcQ/YjbR family DNA-binding protein [Coprobacter sp.]|nr:MmcQ/YjbR family DNA-binding protein [Coprobacter sp.]